MSEPSHDLLARARRVKLLLLDVDGVLTDATVVLASESGEHKSFSIRDGAALVWARDMGLEIGLLSGRASDATSRRAKELGITTVLQAGPDKRGQFESLLTARGLAGEDVAYMGDDLQDLPVIARVGLSAAPADAVPEVLARVHWTSARRGGHGAVRDFVELILRARGQWDQLVVARFLN